MSITSVDFLPTLARLAGAELPTSQPVDGVDISPLLTGQEIDDRSIFWHYPLYLQGRGLTIDVPGGKKYSWRGFPSTSLRRADWKLIEFHEDNSIGPYNLKADPSEKNNLARSRPDLAAKLHAELNDWQNSSTLQFPRKPILSAFCPDKPATRPILVSRTVA